jgi:hypothetical protein
MKSIPSGKNVRESEVTAATDAIVIVVIVVVIVVTFSAESQCLENYQRKIFERVPSYDFESS